MYENGGVAYVYLCYGIHHLFNVVTHVKGVPHAVLVRAAEPLEGLSLMSYRSGRPNGDSRVCSGPGKLARAMGITCELNGRSLLHARFHIADDGLRFSDDIIRSTPRIGVDYAGDDALLRYRFIVGGSPFLSGSRTFNEVR
jgi:DNA-3-methyladenine glycosylase